MTRTNELEQLPAVDELPVPERSLALRCDSKVITTLKARCAMVGVALHVIDDDKGSPLFVASRWSLTRQLHSVSDVEDFLRRIGGPNA